MAYMLVLNGAMFLGFCLSMTLLHELLLVDCTVLLVISVLRNTVFVLATVT